MLLAWVVAGFLLGVLVCYLADVLPVARRLTRPVWRPFSPSGFVSYLTRPRNALVVLSLMSLARWLAGLADPVFAPGALLLVGAYFVLVIVIDVEHRLVLHVVSLAGLVLLGAIGWQWVGPGRMALGALAGFGSMLGLYLLGGWLARLRGRGEAEPPLGFGDVTISGVIGALLGWPSVLSGLFFGVLFAGLFGLLYLLWALTQRSALANLSIAYAPFLCLGAITTIVLAMF